MSKTCHFEAFQLILAFFFSDFVLKDLEFTENLNNNFAKHNRLCLEFFWGFEFYIEWSPFESSKTPSPIDTPEV